jgi:hypothetical protein
MSKHKPSNKTLKLFDRLRKELDMDIPEDATVRRTYAGVHQKGSGAWTWFLLSKTRSIDIGSCYPVTRLLKSNKLSKLTDSSRMTQILPED